RCLKHATALVGVLAVAGCVEEARRTIDQTMSALTAQPSAARMPPDDGTACYMRERIGFYRAAQSANRSQEILQLGGELTTSLLTQFGQSGAGYGNAFQKLLLQNFTDAVQKLQTGVQQDEQRIREFQQAFDALYDCRRREA